jgi:hypothetical protein
MTLNIAAPAILAQIGATGSDVISDIGDKISSMIS